MAIKKGARIEIQLLLVQYPMKNQDENKPATPAPDYLF